MARQATREDLRLPADRDGWVRPFRFESIQYRRPHRHDELELNLVFSGSAAYIIDEQRYDLDPGTILWLFPGQDHVLIQESSDFAMWIAVFAPRMLQRVCTAPRYRELLGVLPAGRFAKQLDDTALEQLAGLCARVSSAEHDLPRSNAGLAFLAVEAWALHEQADQITARSDVHPAVERAAKLLRDEAEPVPMREIARRAGLSESQLSRLFHRQTGVSLVHYRLLQRLERFRQLYARGRRRNLTQAALAAGFGSYSHFHRAFKKVYGYSPREHSRRLREA